MKLLYCKNCGTIYKIVGEGSVTEIPKGEYFVTDFGDKIFYTPNIIECENCDEYSNYELIECEDWVADKIFTIKGG